MRTIEAPKVATWLLKHFCPSPNRESLTGDLAERYRRGQSPAWYWRQVLIATFLTPAADLWNRYCALVVVVGLSGFLIGITLTAQTSHQLKLLQAVAFTPQLVFITLVREHGPLLAAFALAIFLTRSTAQPPGIFSAVVSAVVILSVLNIAADSLGIVGLLVGIYALGISAALHQGSAWFAVENWHVLEGVTKAFLFGAVLATINYLYGHPTIQRSLGTRWLKTRRICASSVAVLMIDFFLTR